MLDIEKVKKAHIMPRRMFLINHLCNESGTDIYYLFGLLNMFNVKNRGKWFWQRASFTGVLKDDFDRFNGFMDNFSAKFNSYDQSRIDKSLQDANELLKKLMTDLETSLFVTKQQDETTIRSYVDENIRGLISQSLKGF